MKTLFIMTFANLKAKKLQSLSLSLVFVSVGILLFLSLRLFGTVSDYEELFEKSDSNQSLILVQDEGVKDTLVNHIDTLDSVENVNVYLNYDKFLESNLIKDGSKKQLLDVFLSEMSNNEYDNIRIVEGKSSSELRDNEVIYSYGKAKLNNIAVGDIVEVSTESGITELTVAGIGVDLVFNFDTISLNRFWTTKNTIENLNDGVKQYSIALSYKDYSKEQEEALFNDFEEVLGTDASNIFILTHALIVQANSFFQVIMGAIFTLIGVIMIVVGLFIIRSIIYNSIITESIKIATLKSTGFSSFNVISMYLLEYGIIALFSVVIGIFGSYLLSDVVLGDLTEISNMFGVSNSLGVLQVVLLSIVIILVIEVIVYLVARRVTKIKPAVALSKGEYITETKTVYSLSKHRRLPLTLVIAIKDIFYNKKLMLTLLLFTITTTLTIVILSSVSYSLNSQRDNNYLWLGYDINAKIISSESMTLDTHNDVTETLMSSEITTGVISTFMDLNSQVLDENNDKFITSISRIFVVQEPDTVDFNMVDGRLPENSNEIIIAYNLKEYLNKELGDYVTIRSLGEEKELLVVGINQGMTNQGMTFDLFENEMNNQILSESLIQFKVKDDVTKNQLTNEISKLFGDNYTVLYETANASMLSMFDVLDVVMTGIIAIFSVICLVVLMNLNLTYIHKERYNYSVYKSIGMSNHEIIKIYLNKNILISIIGLTVGSIISIGVLSFIMNAIMSQLGLSFYPSKIKNISMLVSFSVMMAVTFINALIIKRTINKISPKELLVE